MNKQAGQRRMLRLVRFLIIMDTPENNQSKKFKDRHELLMLIGNPPEGSHEDEWLPRAGTWHQERVNMLAEIAKLRTTMAHIRTILQGKEDADIEQGSTAMKSLRGWVGLRS